MYEEQDWRIRARLYYERHTIEIILIIVFVILALNFVIGRYVNQKMANKWLKQISKVLKDYFCVINGEQVQEGDILDFEDKTSNEFQIMATGRETMKFVNLNLVLQKRHDLATTLFTQTPLIKNLFPTEKDRLWIEIPIERTSEVASEILFVRNRYLNQAKKAQPHIGIFMSPTNPNAIKDYPVQSKGLLCLAENQESVESLFSE